MQNSLRILLGGNVQSALRDRRLFVCVLGRDPERNKKSRTNLWTFPPDAPEFASDMDANLLPLKPKGKKAVADMNTRRCRSSMHFVSRTGRERAKASTFRFLS